MADGTELRKLVKKLQEKSNSESDIVDLLKILRKDFIVTESLLRESKAGLAVGKLRQHNSKEISDLAKELVKKWKGQVEQAKQGSGSSQGIEKAPAIKSKPSPANAATPTTPVATNTARTAKIDGAKGGTGDSTRDRCIELIYDGLAVDSPAPTDQILSKARAVETGVYDLTDNSTGNDYKQKIRSLFVNLKDKNNPGLRRSVVEGDIDAEKLATMSSQELASEERKNADRKIAQDNLFRSLAAAEQQAETDALQCGRCKQRKCRYRQAQTRSADEPMTTFVTCTNCNNRWKFS